MSASTLEMVILCITMSITLLSSACHFCRAVFEKLLLTPFLCNFFLPLRGANQNGLYKLKNLLLMLITYYQIY